MARKRRPPGKNVRDFALVTVRADACTCARCVRVRERGAAALTRPSHWTDLVQAAYTQRAGGD